MTLADLLNNVEVQGDRVCIDLLDGRETVIDHIEELYAVTSVPEKYEDYEIKYIYPGANNSICVEAQEPEGH